MKYTLQHCCDNTMNDKMALYREYCFLNCREYCFLNCTKFIVNKDNFVGFRGGDRPNFPPWIHLCLQRCWFLRSLIAFLSTNIAFVS